MLKNRDGSLDVVIALREDGMEQMRNSVHGINGLGSVSMERVVEVILLFNRQYHELTSCRLHETSSLTQSPNHSSSNPEVSGLLGLAWRNSILSTIPQTSQKTHSFNESLRVIHYLALTLLYLTAKHPNRNSITQASTYSSTSSSQDPIQCHQ